MPRISTRSWTTATTWRCALSLTALTLAGCGPSDDTNKTATAANLTQAARGPVPAPLATAAPVLVAGPSGAPTLDGADVAPRPRTSAEPAKPQPMASVARYRCADGSRITVRLDRDNGEAEIERDGKRLARLDERRAEAGVLYESDGYAFEGDARRATLTAPDMPPSACRAVN